ncbi:hypothetical protein PINS_up018181 [Pythium insidiosum]|nr:hypothetical protein PINS_up018181 [Pythium insidiosum]
MDCMYVCSTRDVAFLIATSASAAQRAIDRFASSAAAIAPAETAANGAKAERTVLAFSGHSVLDRLTDIRDRAATDWPSTESRTTRTSTLSSEPSTPPASRSVDLQSLGSVHTISETVEPPETASPRARLQLLSTDALRSLSDHVVICGDLLHALQVASYIAPVFSELQANATVLLVLQRIPSDGDIRGALACLDDASGAVLDRVVIASGAAQNMDDMLRVRAHAARSVIILPSDIGGLDSSLSSSSQQQQQQQQETNGTATAMAGHLVDFQVVLATLSLHTMNQQLQRQRHSQRLKSAAMAADPTDWPQAPSVCSVVHSGGEYRLHRSSSWHGDRTRRRRGGTSAVPASATFSPPFAAGEIFVDGTLDTLLCQSFFNPYIIDLVRAMVGDTKHRNRSERRQSKTRECSSHSDRSSDSKYGDADVDDWTSNTPSVEEEHSVAMVSMPIPRELEDQSFGRVFQHVLAERGALAIGIYRRARDPRRGNALPYVVTCPRVDMIVERGDSLFVLPSSHGRRRASTCPA